MLDGKKLTSFPLQEQGKVLVLPIGLQLVVLGYFIINIFRLISGIGVGLSWHKSEPYKLMVAQRNGIVVFYNIIKQHAIQSVSVGKGPLLSVDWAPNNNYFIACSSYAHAYIVDVARPYST